MKKKLCNMFFLVVIVKNDSINLFSSIKWSKNNQEYLTLPGKSSTTEIRELERVTSKLRIKDAEAEDAGRYACHATNAFGTSSFNIDVTIWGKGLVKPIKHRIMVIVGDFPSSSPFRTSTDASKLEYTGYSKSKCENCLDRRVSISGSGSIGSAMERTNR